MLSVNRVRTTSLNPLWTRPCLRSRSPIGQPWDCSRFQTVGFLLSETCLQYKSPWNKPITFDVNFKICYSACLSKNASIFDWSFFKNLKDCTKNARGIIHSLLQEDIDIASLWHRSFKRPIRLPFPGSVAIFTDSTSAFIYFTIHSFCRRRRKLRLHVTDAN